MKFQSELEKAKHESKYKKDYNKSYLKLCLFFIIFLSVGCSAMGRQIEPTITSIPSTATPNPPTATLTPTVTFTPSPSPTPVGGLSGEILFVRREFREGLYPRQFPESLHSMPLPDGPVEDFITKENFGAAVGKTFESLYITPSPDGNKAFIYACMLSQGTFDGATCIRGALYFVSTDLRLIKELKPDFDGAEWSPDSQRLLVYQQRGSMRVIDKDGTISGTLASLDLNDGFPSWSPDGSRIYWFNGQTGLWSVAANGSAAKESYPDEAMKTTSSNHISFSRDGNKVAFMNKEDQMVVANGDFSDPIRLLLKVDLPFKSPSIIVGGEEVYMNTNYWLSSTGNYLLLDGCLGQTGSGSCDKKAPLILINVDTNQQVLLEEPGDVETCGFSPDDRIVLLLPGYTTDGYLELVDAQQPENKNASYRIPYNGECPVWLP